MKELLDLIAKALVDRPERVRVNQIDRGETAVLELLVAPEDLGKVIGRQGRTARAIRALLGVGGMKRGRRFVLDILEHDSAS